MKKVEEFVHYISMKKVEVFVHYISMKKVEEFVHYISMKKVEEFVFNPAPNSRLLIFLLRFLIFLTHL